MLKTILQLGIIMAAFTLNTNSWADCAKPLPHVIATSSSTTISARSAPIDINNATADELMQLKGIGRKKAEAIIEYRIQHHGFKAITELDQVKGIGKKLLEQNQAHLTVSQFPSDQFTVENTQHSIVSPHKNQLLLNTSY